MPDDGANHFTGDDEFDAATSAAGRPRCALDATGWVLPKPREVMDAAGMPSVAR